MTTLLYKIHEIDRKYPDPSYRCSCGLRPMCPFLSGRIVFHKVVLSIAASCPTCGSRRIANLDLENKEDAVLMKQGGCVYCIDCRDVYR